MYNLITVENKNDADAIEYAFVRRFGHNYVVHCEQVQEMSFISGYKLSAQYTGKKRETNPQVNINTIAFREFAYAFHLGLVEGRIQARQEE